MKIEGPKHNASTSGAKKSGKKTASSESDFEGFMGAGGATEASSASAPQTIARVDSLLTVQASEDPTERAARKRMMDRADDVLGELDQLHAALLQNRVTMGHMIDIADMIAHQKEKITDPKMISLLEEIDLRAQVELAKMRKAMSRL